MGIHSCSGPIGGEELQAVMLGGELEMCGELGSSSTFAVNRCQDVECPFGVTQSVKNTNTQLK